MSQVWFLVFGLEWVGCGFSTSPASVSGPRAAAWWTPRGGSAGDAQGARLQTWWFLAPGTTGASAGRCPTRSGGGTRDSCLTAVGNYVAERGGLTAHTGVLNCVTL